MYDTNAMSRLHKICQEPRSLFEFPSCSSIVTINVRHVYSSPSCRELVGSSPTWRNSLSLGQGMGAERSQTCGVSLFKASPSRGALNALPLVSSDTLTPLVYYVCELCAISRLEILIYTYVYMLAHTLLLGLTLEYACVLFETICKNVSSLLISG